MCIRDSDGWVARRRAGTKTAAAAEEALAGDAPAASDAQTEQDGIPQQTQSSQEG